MPSTLPVFSLPVTQHRTTKEALDDEMNRCLGLLWPLSEGGPEGVLDEVNEARDEVAGIADDLAAALDQLPAMTSANARQRAAVNAGGTAYEFVDRVRRLILAYSQSNFSRSATYAGVWPINLFVWDGGIAGATGTQWQSARDDLPTTIRLPMKYAAEYAIAHPDEDVYLVICASPGVSVRAAVGMDYLWDTGLSGDPGTGCIAFNHATMGSVTQVRYSETDADGYPRFVGGSDLGVSLTTPARIAVAGNPAIFAEFTISTEETDHGAYRSQTVAVTSSASWPPADGTPVIVYPATDRLRTVISVNLEAAMTALGLTGDQRVMDEVLIWPTESDVNYLDAYAGRDHADLIAYLATWTDGATQFTYTLPWPYSAVAANAIRRWWHAIEEIVARKPAAVLVDLAASRQSDWETATDYIHVDSAADMERVGRLMHRSAARGGMHLPRYESGPWAPTPVAITNTDGVTITGGRYQRIGRDVDFRIRVVFDATTNAAIAQFALSLPVASDLKQVHDAIGVGASGAQAYIARVSADVTNDRLLVDLFAESAGAYSLWITGGYLLD